MPAAAASSPTTILIFICLLLLTLHLWLRYTNSYWQRHGLPHVRPMPLLGNLKELLQLRISFGEFFQQLYKVHDAPLVGIYMLHRPALLVRDPELIQLVLIKRFNMFLNRYEAADAQHDAMGALSLPLAKYPVWRESRKRMSTYFTSGNIKHNMYPQMLQIAAELERHIKRQCAIAHAEKVGLRNKTASTCIIEVKEMCALFTTDLTALLMYGVHANCLRNARSPMFIETKDLLTPTVRKAWHFFIVFFLPHLATLLRAKVFSARYSAFMRRLVMKISQQRKKGPISNRWKWSHLVENLLQFREENSRRKHFSNNVDFVPSQAAIFLLAGFETSSSLIAFTLYELARQPALQQRLRLEVREALLLANSSSLAYEELTSLPYLNMVVAESLRMYPAAAFINRECTPGEGVKGCSLAPFSEYVVPAAMPAYISILGLHRDSKYWPNPNHFDPERFSTQTSHRHHPMTYIPFGSGPHSCIGSRLGILQIKLGLVHILKEFRVEICASSVHEIKFDPNSFMLQAHGGIYLNFIRDELKHSKIT